MVVTDSREQPVQNTDWAPKKRSNPTPEQGGWNGGGQKPPTTMHGTGDPTQMMVTMMTITTKGRIRKEAQVAWKRAKINWDQILRQEMKRKTS